jgi:hypothetical protein
LDRRTFGLFTRRLRELLGFRPKGLVIVEQGTRQVAFTTLVLQLYRVHHLTVATMDALARPQPAYLPPAAVPL